MTEPADDGYEFYVDKHWNVIEKAGPPRESSAVAWNREMEKLIYGEEEVR